LRVPKGPADTAPPPPAADTATPAPTKAQNFSLGQTRPSRKGSSWRQFLGHYREHFLACDFLTVETVWLKTLYALFFIGLDTRRVRFAGCTAHPTGEWGTQQARNLTWTLQDEQVKRYKRDEHRVMRF